MRHVAGAAFLTLAGLFLAGACRDEFPTDETAEVAVDSTLPFSRTMVVRDLDTLLARFTTEGRHLVGAAIQWTSSDPDRLELRAIPADGGNALEAQTRVQAIAHARGAVTVTAMLQQPGLDTLSVQETVTILERWVSVTTGAGYSCGLTVDEQAYCWGGLASELGETGMGLGNGSSTGSDRPVPVAGGLRFRAITAGDLQTCGISTPTGLLYCWGRNLWGELGNGSFDDVLIPTLTVRGRNFAQVSPGIGLTCAITSTDFLEGRLPGPLPHNTLCWGRASFGGLGSGHNPDTLPSAACREDLTASYACEPRSVSGVSIADEANLRLRNVSVGNGFACGVAIQGPEVKEGEAVCWGIDSLDQLGEGIPLGPIFEPIRCNARPPITNFPSVPCSPFPLSASSGLTFTVVASGGRTTCGVSAGKVYCWGGWYGATPQEIATPPGEGSLLIDSVSVGGTTVGAFGSAEPFGFRSGEPPPFDGDAPFACALSTDGRAFCWGDNMEGELGNGELPEPNTTIPHRNQMEAVDQDTLVFVAISAASRLSTFDEGDSPAHACALTRDGAIYCWGSNHGGRLGVGGMDRATTPVRISEPEQSLVVN